MSRRAGRRFGRFAAVAAATLLAGCGGIGTARDPVAVAVQNRALLRDALEAWQAGRVAELAHRAPPIRFVDDDQAAGLKLVGYEIKNPPPGLDPPGVAVTLTLRDAKRHAIVRHASYRIDTGAEVVVQREES